MALTITNNVASLTAQHNLGRSSSALNRSLERLSSGLKVNRGADGPAALTISEKQRAQIAGLEQAIENSGKAVAVVQTAEGALNEINTLLNKARSLALDSANTGVNDDDALAANQAEIDNLLDTVDRIANNTQFATKKLLDGSAGLKGETTDANVKFLGGTTDTQAGTYAVAVTTAGERAQAAATTAQTGNLAADEILTVNGINITLSAGLSQTDVVNRINEYTSQTGVVADANGASSTTRLYSVDFGTDADISVVSNTAAAATSTGFGTSKITDTGANVIGTINGVTYNGSGNVLTSNSGVTDGLRVAIEANTGANAHATVTGSLGVATITDNSLQFQIGPNQHQTANLAINQVNPDVLGVGVTNNQFNNLAQINVTSHAKAQDSIGIIDSAINEISNLRGSLGAFQSNTLEATANNMRTTLENSINVESVIRDTDFASEIANYTKQQVLVQAGTSILGNANQMSQLVLGLL
ncbi:MAG: flagellin [Pirellulaceae bacterium]|nr:hypothetical protein [Planctomycetales bacterium]